MAFADKFYAVVFQEKGERATGGVAEEAHDNVPWNFLLQLLARLASKIGYTLSKPSLVLTWLMLGVGAPAYLIGALVPVRESGSLFPQLVVAGFMQRRPIRKGFWVAGSFGQGLSVGGMALAALSLDGATAGWCIILLLGVFALSRGICSVTSKELLGKTIPKKRRGRLGGLASSSGGIVGIAVGVVLVFYRGEDFSLPVIVVLLFVAAGMWTGSAMLMAALREPPSEVGNDGNALGDILPDLRFFLNDKQFLRFCISRGLLAGTVLSTPFYVVLTKEHAGGSGGVFGTLIILSSLAQFVSGFAWGRLADHSSRLTLVVAGGIAGAIGVITFLAAQWGVSETTSLIVYGLLYFLINLCHTGIRLGRKTYLVDFAPAERRPAYVAMSNTFIGIVLLASTALGALAELLGPAYLILMFATLGSIGAGVAYFLPEAEDA